MTKYRLLRDFGNQAFDPIGGLRHGFPAGTVGTLDEKVEAATVGAHNLEEDALVLTFDDEARSIGPDGEMKTAPVTRRVSFAVAEFDPKNAGRLFDEVKS